MSMSEIKREARKALHEVHGEPCVCTLPDGTAFPSAEQSAEGLRLTARFASKLKTISPVEGGDGVALLENIERLIFQDDELVALGLRLEHNSTVVFAGYGLTFILDQEMDRDGPLNIYWTVVRGDSGSPYWHSER